MARWSLLFPVLVVISGGHAGASEVPRPDMVFPIPGLARARTEFDEGRFGAFRPGHRPLGCGRGHCGVDLCAPDGTPVVAIMSGSVDQVERSVGGLGGRWVRVLHDDGTATWYMHLASVRPDLVRGTRVNAGETIGILGRTGVHSSPTHLHFALTIGPAGHEKHLDPTPLLERGELLPAPLP